MRKILGISLLIFVGLVGVACEAALDAPVGTPVPTPSPTSVPAASATATPEQPVPTVTPDTVPEALKTPGPTPLATPSPSSRPAPTPTPAATVHATPAPTLGPVADESGCTSDPAPSLTHVITDLTKIDFIVPMIVPSGNWLKNRSYFRIKDDPDAPGQGFQVPVYAPVDAVLTGITRYVESVTNLDGVLVEQDQFDLEFRVSCEISFGFDHVARLVGEPELVQPLVAVRDTRDAQKSVSVAVSAGDLIGHTRGTSGAHTWDFLMRNTGTDIRYANQERYEAMGDLRKLRDAECPYDFYDEGLRSQYLALFGGWGGGATGAEACLGSPDIAGTISGGWFNAAFDPDGDLYVAGWGAVVVLGADGTVEINDGQRMIRTRGGAPTFASPATVTTEHCYEHMNQPTTFAYLRLLSATAMDIATGDGACPAGWPGGHKTVYR
jgi:hypothetical protein